MSDDTEGAVFASYLKNQTCYDIVPKSAKIVIFDTRLLVGYKLRIIAIYEGRHAQKSLSKDNGQTFKKV